MDNLVKEFSVFNGKRVLVTGDTGFKGAWLCLWLKQLGAVVNGFALPPEQDSLFNALNLASLINHTDGDIRNEAELLACFQQTEPEFVFHLAAQSLVRLSYTEPKSTFDTNVGGSVNLLEAVRSTPSVRSLVYVTSDKCYRNREWIWGYREHDELGGHDPYSASKAAAEVVIASYTDSFFRARKTLGVASVRAGNVIGGGDWALDRIVPDCVRALLDGRPIQIRNPHATRPWQHVLDPLSGYLLVASRLYREPERFGGAWNFGPRAESIRTVHDLAHTLIRYWGSGTTEEAREDNAPHEATLLHLNCDKAHHLLGWHAGWDFEQAVAETAVWYRETAAGAAAVEITGRQIASFMEASQ